MERQSHPAAARRPRTGLWAVIRREVHIIAHSPFYTLFLFLLPLGTFVVLGATFYEEIPRDMPIVICDRDDSGLSRQLIRMADATSALAVKSIVQDMEAGAAAIRRGEAYALIYIPENTERDAKRSAAPAITMYYNNQWLLTSGVISRAVREVIGTISAGLDLRSRMLKGEAPAEAMQHYEPIRVDTHPLFNPNMNYRFFLLPALFPTMIQAFVIMVAARALGGELKHGTAGEWLAVSGNRPWVACIGKLIPHGVCFSVLSLFMMAALVRFANVPFLGDPWVIGAATILFVAAYQSVGLALVAITANLRMANSLAGFYSGPAFAFAGITYPTAGMPLAAKCWGAGLPLTHYLYILMQQMLSGVPSEAAGKSLLYLSLFVIIPPILFMPRMARLMRDPACWGKL